MLKEELNARLQNNTNRIRDAKGMVQYYPGLTGATFSAASPGDIATVRAG